MFQTLEAPSDLEAENVLSELPLCMHSDFLFSWLPRLSPLNPSAASDLSTYSTASLISNEEQFEDYGEGDDVDYTPSSPCPDDESRTNAYSDLGSSVSSRLLIVFPSCLQIPFQGLWGLLGFSLMKIQLLPLHHLSILLFIWPPYLGGQMYNQIKANVSAF